MINTKNLTIDETAWIPIPGYEWVYEINIGKNEIRSKYKRGRILSLGVLKSGHLICGLYKHGQQKVFGFHQIVMLIVAGPCPDGMEVCHNDGNPKNNSPSNLRYDTRRANFLDSVKHGTHIPIRKGYRYWLGKTGGLHPTSKKVKQYLLDGTYINTYASTREAGKILGCAPSGISHCAVGKQKSCKGYIWMYT